MWNSVQKADKCMCYSNAAQYLSHLRKPSTDQLNELINCQICGDTSTGFHYGVHSCEGCKGFFRRSISQHTTYTCTNKESCEISIYTRNQCQLCRWKKCLSAGMSKDASRLGRRSKRMIERMQDMISLKHDGQEKPMKDDYMRHPWGSAQSSMFNGIRNAMAFKGQNRYGSSSNPYSMDQVRVKSENPRSVCEFESFASKEMSSGDFRDHCGKSGAVSDRFEESMSSNTSGTLGSSSLSDIKGISAEAINKMLLSGQPVILIPQQIGSASRTMAVNGQIPPAVVVVSQPSSDNSQESEKGMEESLHGDGSSSEQNSPEEQKVPESPNFNSLFPEQSCQGSLGDRSEVHFQKPTETQTSQSMSPPQKDENFTHPSVSPGNDMMDVKDIPKEPLDIKDFGQLPSPMFGNSLSPFLPPSLNSPGKFFPFETPTPSPQDGSAVSPKLPSNIPPFEIDFSEPTPEQEARLSKLIKGVAKVHHDICHFTKARIRILKAKYYGIVEPDVDKRGRKLHDCSNCPLPPDFPTSDTPPRELDILPELITPSHMVQFFANKFTSLITRIVIFTKQIPGFRSLHKEDQVTLIKSGLFEVAAVRFTTVMDLERHMVHYWTTGDSFTKEMALKSPLGKIIDLLFDFARCFSKFELTDDEIGLLNAVIMVAPDRAGLKRKDEVQLLQADLLKALQIEIKRQHPEDPSIFAKLLTTIPKLREIGPEHTKRLMELKVQNPLMTKLSPLHAEVFNLTD
ncbi:nuclear receptor subfamily 1 group D member 2-like isoform X2 [Ptychodera flava]|uniref:nuclear receptor subfamily 1 group D member 2-like isoform X2 n=1 Tax=Ptychodera flava TaxID=63121 RepID=UPI00396A4FB5